MKGFHWDLKQLAHLTSDQFNKTMQHDQTFHLMPNKEIAQVYCFYCLKFLLLALTYHTGKSNQFSTQKLLWLIFGFLKIHKKKKTRHGDYMDFVWILSRVFWNPQNNHIWSNIFHATYGNFSNHVGILNFPSMDFVY